jgi:hypothetical protein
MANKSNEELGIFRVPIRVEKVINKLMLCGTLDISGEELQVKADIGRAARKTGAFTYSSPHVFTRRRIRVIRKTPKHIIIQTKNDKGT